MKNLLKKIRMFFLLRFHHNLISCGENNYFAPGTRIRKNTVSVGDNSFIGNDCWLACPMEIGNYVMLAARVAAVGGDHQFEKAGTPSIESGRGTMKKIIIEDDVWVGYGVILMHGVTLGEGCIIAAGSLITKNVDSYMIVGGVPAKVIRNRFKDDTEINIHRSMLLNRNRRRK